MKERFLNIGGHSIYVADSERGEQSVVLLHGYLESLRVWDDFVGLLTEAEFRKEQAAGCPERTGRGSADPANYI